MYVTLEVRKISENSLLAVLQFHAAATPDDLSVREALVLAQIRHILE
jgi:hypothetical protein